MLTLPSSSGALVGLHWAGKIKRWIVQRHLFRSGLGASPLDEGGGASSPYLIKRVWSGLSRGATEPFQAVLPLWARPHDGEREGERGREREREREIDPLRASETLPPCPKSLDLKFENHEFSEPI